MNIVFYLLHLHCDWLVNTVVYEEKCNKLVSNMVLGCTVLEETVESVWKWCSGS